MTIPKDTSEAGWDNLVKILDSGSYIARTYIYYFQKVLEYVIQDYPR